MGLTDFRRDMIHQLEQLEFQTHKMMQIPCEKQIPKMRCRHFLSGTKYYLIENGREVCIGCDDSFEVQKIKKERFAAMTLRILYGNISALKRCISRYTDISAECVNEHLPKSYQIYDYAESQTPVNQAAHHISNIQRISSSDSACITVDGRRVRSKGETIIYNLLIYSGLDFDYEKMLRLRDNEGNRKVIIPDFTIFLGGGKKIYWEHMGMLNDNDYFSRQCEKIRLYHDNGITIGDNLILTADRADGTLNSEIFDDIIAILRHKNSIRA